MTRFLSVFIDAWEQLRLQRIRVLMSLIGVTVAVAALTASLALGNIMAKTQEESIIRSSGPEATYSMQLAGTQPSQDALVASFREATDRYGISYATPVIDFDTGINADGYYVQGLAVDRPFFSMTARPIIAGRGFNNLDSERIAPVAIVTEGLANVLGLGDLRAHPTIEVQGAAVTVVGVVANTWTDDMGVFVLADHYFRQLATPLEEGEAYTELRIWIPPEEDPDALAGRVANDIASKHDGLSVMATRIDAGAYEMYGPDPSTITTIVLSSVSIAILALGALSLVNIAVVTVRHRIREFGIRRAFGASQRRIFVGVMMESVVGTFVAGLIGVGIVAILYRSPMVQNLFGGVASTLPPFPVDAAVTGIVVSILTGVLAGMIPAVIAVRSKVIDAIRF